MKTKKPDLDALRRKAVLVALALQGLRLQAETFADQDQDALDVVMGAADEVAEGLTAALTAGALKGGG